jgi:hypothetical protein
MGAAAWDSGAAGVRQRQAPEAAGCSRRPSQQPYPRVGRSAAARSARQASHSPEPDVPCQKVFLCGHNAPVQNPAIRGDGRGLCRDRVAIWKSAIASHSTFGAYASPPLSSLYTLARLIFSSLAMAVPPMPFAASRRT